nr:LPD11 domain-containing protein [Blautia luti]
MMLSRLQSDCEYYLNYGNRCTGRLYYLDEEKQIAAMKKLGKEFPDDGKPEWLTWEQILEYEKAMCPAIK